MTHLLPRIGLVILAVAGGHVATLRAATIFSYTGNLRTDANFVSCGAGCELDGASLGSDYAQWAAVSRTFHVSAASTMTAITFSYGGGTNGAGSLIADAGFEPYLSLFDATGNFLTSTFFGTTCPPGANPSVTLGSCYDVLLDGGTLASGDYRVALSAFENLSFTENLGSGTLADGFTGLGNLASGEDLHYAFDVVLSPISTSVPEPGTGFFLAAGLMAFCLWRPAGWRKRCAEHPPTAASKAQRRAT
ncbi:MAG: DVUA0089 family protein [Candidatus Solibacter sp.]|nr:DVUA0089 family protein [Candidatus Solibacter sp.]